MLTAGTLLADGSGAIGISKYVAKLKFEQIEKALITTKIDPVITGICSLCIHVNLDLPMVNTLW